MCLGNQTKICSDLLPFCIASTSSRKLDVATLVYTKIQYKQILQSEQCYLGDSAWKPGEYTVLCKL